MVDFIPQERATPIRYPSTANLMLDSKDRPSPLTTSPFDFAITKTYSLMNGYFTRIGTTEVVLEWCVNNISAALGNLSFSITDNNNTVHTITLTGGAYTVAEAMDEIVALLNGLNLAGYNWESTLAGGRPILGGGGTNDFTVLPPTKLSVQLGFDPLNQVPEISQELYCPDLRPYRYIDFVSPQLTYNQDVKDSSTAPFVRDVLCRWYFADDVPPERDALGLPILMGYTSFCRRRLYNPPKQIKWSSNQPLGNLTFQVYGDDGNIITDFEPQTNWLMTLQFSEV